MKESRNSLGIQNPIPIKHIESYYNFAVLSLLTSFEANRHMSIFISSASILLRKLELPCGVLCSPGVIPQLFWRHWPVESWTLCLGYAIIFFAKNRKLYSAIKIPNTRIFNSPIYSSVAIYVNCMSASGVAIISVM